MTFTASREEMYSSPPVAEVSPYNVSTLYLHTAKCPAGREESKLTSPFPLGVAHSEENEGFSDWVHFLQIWATPWSRGLAPRYHTRTFDEGAKRLGFIHIISPLAAGRGATAEQELAAVPRIENTIPIHADLIMGAAIIPVDKRFAWTIGAGDKVQKTKDRKVYVHLPMTKRGSAKIRLDGREGAVLSEGDGAFVEGVDAGDVLGFESIGEAEAEVVVLDSN